VLVLVAAIADRFGSHGLAFDALLVAVPVGAAGLLTTVGDVVDRRADRRRLVFAAAMLALIVLAAAARSPLAAAGSVPALAQTALVACLALFTVEVLAGVAAELRSPKPVLEGE
jgi:hypothetical protein